MKNRRESDKLTRRELLILGLSAGIGLGITSCGDDTASSSEDLLPTLDLTNEPPAFLDHSRPLQERVDDLVSRMTLKEKVAQMGSVSPGIPRLGVPPYNWWNEALHGVGRAGEATVFPQAIGMASTWNTDLMQQIATVIADEGRAKHHAAAQKKIYSEYPIPSPI